jgi:16S rRNA (cytidine1402-2'-O)-methyltransferase
MSRMDPDNSDPHIKFDEPDLPLGLYLLPSPIGNLGDISRRFISVLSRVNIVAAEDTRRTLRLLNHLGLKKRLLSYREENHGQMFSKLLAFLENGLSVALISDAGAPGVCDPGSRLVRTVREAGFSVYPLPGSSAVITALMASGMTASRFTFMGFLPPAKTRRKIVLESIRELDHNLVFFIPPHKLEDCLADFLEILGDREAFMAREMTKVYEEYLFLPLSELLNNVTERKRKGEITLVLGQAIQRDLKAPYTHSHPDEDQLRRILRDSVSVKEAAGVIAASYNISRKKAYDTLLRLSPADDSEAAD